MTKPNTTAAGYGSAHQKERARLTPIVNAGDAYCAQPICLEPTRWIRPGTPWDLGHNETRTAWIGPTHRRCNQTAGASKGGRVIAARQRGTTYVSPVISSQEW